MSSLSITTTTNPSFCFRTVPLLSSSPKTPVANEVDNAENEQPSLFTLPYDIRYMIYKLVLQPEFPLRRWEHYMVCPGCNIDITGASISKCTSILRTNRQIYHEASPIIHNIEHLIQGLQKPSEGLWRHVFPNADGVKIRRSGGVRKLTELETLPLRNLRYDITFADWKSSGKEGGNRQGSVADPPFLGPWGMGIDLMGLVSEMPAPPVLEENTLRYEVQDLVRVLKEGSSVRRVSISLRKWPRWNEKQHQQQEIQMQQQEQDGQEGEQERQEDDEEEEPKPPTTSTPSIMHSGIYEIPGCSVSEMLGVFDPLIRFQLPHPPPSGKASSDPHHPNEMPASRGQRQEDPPAGKGSVEEEVSITAELCPKHPEACYLTREFVERFNISRRDFLLSSKKEVRFCQGNTRI